MPTTASNLGCECKKVERGQTQLRVDDLHFYLYERTLHPELFQINKIARLQQRRYSAEIWALGLAHLVTFQFENGFVTELVSPHNEILPKGGLSTSFRFRGERDHTQTLNNGLTYILSSQVERLTPQVFPSTHRDLVRHAQRKGLFVTFPDLEIDGVAPFTYVDYEARDHEFHVYAYHSFPDDLTILKTQSIFELQPERRTR